MKQAAVGFRTHSGWAAMVAVSLEKGEPVVLSRERVHLVEEFSYRFRQPYHTAEKMKLDEARRGRGGTARLSSDSWRSIGIAEAGHASHAVRVVACFGESASPV